MKSFPSHWGVAPLKFPVKDSCRYLPEAIGCWKSDIPTSFAQELQAVEITSRHWNNLAKRNSIHHEEHEVHEGTLYLALGVEAELPFKRFMVRSSQSQSFAC
jgi:hypothetical protein